MSCAPAEAEEAAIQRTEEAKRVVQQVQVALKPEAGAIDALLSQTQPGSPYVCPPGTEAERAAKFQEFWDAVELLRLLFARPETWEATFTVGGVASSR